eukprot:2300993-Amphidinium_carterae.1
MSDLEDRGNKAQANARALQEKAARYALRSCAGTKSMLVVEYEADTEGSLSDTQATREDDSKYLSDLKAASGALHCHEEIACVGESEEGLGRNMWWSWDAAEALDMGRMARFNASESQRVLRPSGSSQAQTWQACAQQALRSLVRVWPGLQVSLEASA